MLQLVEEVRTCILLALLLSAKVMKSLTLELFFFYLTLLGHGHGFTCHSVPPYKGHSRHCVPFAKCHNTDQLLWHYFAYTWVSIETGYLRQTKRTGSERDLESGMSGWVCCRAPGASWQHSSDVLAIKLQVATVRKALGLFTPLS